MNLFKIENLSFNFNDELNKDEEVKLQQAISHYLKQKKLSIALMIIGFCFISYIIGIPIMIYGIYLFVKIKKTITINYDFSKETIDDVNELIANLQQINKCSARWQVMSSSHTDKARINAGANNLITRKKLKATSNNDYFITSNINYCVLNVVKGKIMFLPNIVVYIKNGKVSLIKYSDFKLEHSISHFRETDPVPKDATILDYTWKYVNNNGTPDKRYKDNVKIAICQYCTFTFNLDSAVENVMVSHFNSELE